MILINHKTIKMITKNLFLTITVFSLFLVNCNNLQNSTSTKEENQVGIIKGNDFRSKAMMKFTDAYVNNDLNSDVVKRKANQELQQIYSQISQKYSWDEIKGEIAQAESGNNPYAINVNEKGRGFDIGKYQINSRYIVGGEGSYELNADGTPSQMFADIKQILDKGLVGVEVEQKSSYTGKKPGFDMGDVFGKDSIFNKEDEIDYGFEDKNIYETLYDNNLIDENWNMYDYNLENK